MPRFEVAFTVTVHDAQPEDVRTLLDQFRAAVGGQAIEISDPSTQRHVRECQQAGVLATKTAWGPWGKRRAQALETLQATQGNIPESAKRLGVTEQTMRDWAIRVGYGQPVLLP